jgi:hypothetical protein
VGKRASEPTGNAPCSYPTKESGNIYQPVFLGVRDDIKPEACTTAQLKYRAPSEDDEDGK